MVLDIGSASVNKRVSHGGVVGARHLFRQLRNLRLMCRGLENVDAPWMIRLMLGTGNRTLVARRRGNLCLYRPIWT